MGERIAGVSSDPEAGRGVGGAGKAKNAPLYMVWIKIPLLASVQSSEFNVGRQLGESLWEKRGAHAQEPTLGLALALGAFPWPFWLYPHLEVTCPLPTPELQSSALILASQMAQHFCRKQHLLLHPF